ncbi:hypothetical protein ACM40_06960 [Chryseobacterium sp. BLS98]|jgi:hypothetical protein|uniref:hypothetical protein n=1 Tax=Chryseobacterium sp. BLS98 TaxID=885586 RepID=UPI00065B08B1|nr:hypothetical protein [Chryseobacterium sp. BLS98]KMQ62047.1 hypothetical protein ACM40_06960 [Chryseobacterium sp. BLS98]
MQNPNKINLENLIGEFTVVFKKEFEQYITVEVNEIKNMDKNHLISFGNDFSASLNIKQNSIIADFLKTRNLEDHYVGNFWGGFATTLVGILIAFTTVEKQEIQEKLIEAINDHNDKKSSPKP